MANWWEQYQLAPQNDVTSTGFAQAPMPAPPVAQMPQQAQPQAAPQAPPQMAPGSAGAQIYAPPRPQSAFAGLPPEILMLSGMAGPQQGMQFLSPFLSAPPVEVMGPDGRPMYVQRHQAMGLPSPKTIIDFRGDDRAERQFGAGRQDRAFDEKMQLGRFNLDTGKFEYEQAKDNRDFGLRTRQQRATEANQPVGVDGAPNIAVTNAAAGQDIAKKDVDQLMAARGDMQQTIAGIKAVHTARELLDKGIVSGSGAEWRLNFGNALKTYLGVEMKGDAVSNTQAYMTALANQISQNLQALRPATDKDVIFAKQMAGGNIDFTPEALRKILDIGEAAAREKITAYQRRAEPYMKAPYIPEEVRQNLRVDMPGDYQAPVRAAPSVTVPMPSPGSGAPWKKY